MAKNITDFHNYNRWNFKSESDGIYVCYGDHPRSNDCDWVELSPEEVVATIEFLVKEILEAKNPSKPVETEYGRRMRHML